MLTSEFVFLAFSSLSVLWIPSLEYLSVFNSSILHWYIHQIFIEYLQFYRHRSGCDKYRHRNVDVWDYTDFPLNLHLLGFLFWTKASDQFEQASHPLSLLMPSITKWGLTLFIKWVLILPFFLCFHSHCCKSDPYYLLPGLCNKWLACLQSLLFQFTLN